MRRHRRRKNHPALVAVLALGWLALVALPGRPMTRRDKAFAEDAHGRMAAAAVPLLSSRSIEDRESFHRLAFAEPAAFSAEPLFRAPGAKSFPGAKRVLTIAKRVTPVEVNFAAPRTSWQHLDEPARKLVALGARRNAGTEWHRILLHGSGSAGGDAASLDRQHRRLRGLRDGLAFHFVIGIGTGSDDGKIEVGARWRDGGAATSLDDHGLGASTIHICLVGDFSSAPPTRAQLEALDELADYLAMTTGAALVASHRAATGGPASCLGAFFPGEEIAAGLHAAAK